MNIKLTNLNPVDIVIDTDGQNNPENKVIIHPRNTVNLTIADSQYSTVKSTPGVVVQVLSKESK